MITVTDNEHHFIARLAFIFNVASSSSFVTLEMKPTSQRDHKLQQ